MQTDLEQFDRQFQKVYTCVFLERPVEEHAFRDPSWPVIWLPEELPRGVAPYFRPLYLAASRYGDTRVVIVDEHGPAAGWEVTSWDPNVFASVRLEFPLGVAIFGKSGKWGAILTDFGFTCLGGTVDFMGPVIESLGGESTLRDEFDRWTRETAVEFMKPDLLGAVRSAAGLSKLEAQTDLMDRRSDD